MLNFPMIKNSLEISVENVIISHGQKSIINVSISNGSKSARNFRQKCPKYLLEIFTFPMDLDPLVNFRQ